MQSAQAVQREVLKVASRFGVGRPLLDVYQSTVGLPHLRHLSGVDEAIRQYELADEDVKGDVVFQFIPGAPGNGYRIGVLAHAFRTRGYRPTLLTSRHDFLRCARQRPGNERSYVCDLCATNSRVTADAFGLPTTTVSELLPASYDVPTPPDDDHPVVEYRGVDLAEYARASTRQYLKRYTIDYDDPYERRVYREFLANAYVLVDACERLFAERDAVAAFGNEVAYVHGGIPLAVAEKHGVPGYSHDMGFRDESVIFGQRSNRNPQPRFSDVDTVRRFVARPLDPEQREAIDRVMEGRASDEGTLFRYSNYTDDSVEVDGDRPVAGMFTNLIWDESLEVGDAEAAFLDVFEWVETTIDHFAARDDAALVVKTHPAERAMGTSQGVADWIADAYNPLPDNVTLLYPDTDVNTYNLIDDVDVGVVYNSTVGLEMAYRGLPVVVGGDTHYRGLGFTVDPDTSAEYLAVLADLENVVATPEMRERARRYAYFTFVHRTIDFPYISMNSAFTEYDCHPVSHDELAPGNDPFDFIVARAVAGEPIIPEA